MKAELKRFGITQGDVADFLGMSANNFSLKINEKIPMTVDEARKINTHFLPTVKLDYLLASDGDVPSERECLHAQADSIREVIDAPDEDMAHIHVALDFDERKAVA